MKDQHRGRLEQARQSRVGFRTPRENPDLDGEQDRRVGNGQAGKLARDELRVCELLDPPEDRIALAVPLGME